MQETKNITLYRLQLRQSIVETAMRLFMLHGIKAVKMDDIAHDLVISKRTLYELYDNKEQLLYEGVRYYHEKRQLDLEAYEAGGHNVLEVIIHLYRYHVEEFGQTNPLFYEDVVKYPSVFNALMARQRHNQSLFLEFMQRGVKEGFFQADVNYQLVAQMFEAFTTHLRQHHLYQQFSFEELFFSTFFVMLRGFCTVKGITFLDQFVNENRQ